MLFYPFTTPNGTNFTTIQDSLGTGTATLLTAMVIQPSVNNGSFFGGGKKKKAPEPPVESKETKKKGGWPW